MHGDSLATRVELGRRLEEVEAQEETFKAEATTRAAADQDALLQAARRERSVTGKTQSKTLQDHDRSSVKVGFCRWCGFPSDWKTPPLQCFCFLFFIINSPHN